jgi:hypothetical protein
MENKRLKDEHIMLEQQVKGKDTNTILQCTLHDGLPQLIISFSSFFFSVRPRRKQNALNRHDEESRAGGIKKNRRKYKAER